jgi:hypothetical protein
MVEQETGKKPPDTKKQPVEPEPEVTVTDQEMTGSESSPVETEFSRAGLILQSVALPGLGLTRYKQQPHWIRGVLGYGCLGGSVALSYLAYDSYTSYQSAGSEGEVEDFFSKAQSQQSTSDVLAFAAIGIWVTDLVWTILGTSDMGKKQTAGVQEGFSIGTRIEPVSSAPLIALRYTF